MREIKFRAFSNERGMIDLNATTGAATIVMWPTMRACEYDGNQKQVDMPLMQYTGLKDKNGVEIYEGDIISNGADIFKVEWCNHSYSWIFNDGESDIEFTAIPDIEIEIIGNIYTDKELLK